MIPFSRRTLLVGAAALAVAKPSLALAQTTHEIQMLNRHPEDKKQVMVFYPNLVQAQVGDVVKFVATDKSHNTVSVKGMLPAGVKGWKGKINEEVEVTLAKPGFYGFNCVPHNALGMVGLIVVEGEGKLDNLKAARSVKHRGPSKKAWDALWKRAEADGLLTS